jgi:hypothetical protein
VLPQASHLEHFAAAELNGSQWVLKSARKTPLRLTPGKHTLRVACNVDAFRPVSRPVEIEIAD